ncbi:MAG TPA: response regulator transcription factor [Pyrinomonadaceae bacterium]|nr:response regulator transcription factor [Pyrinomonadaceae bacterium]
MDNKIKVLIAEDHNIVREGLKMIIDSQPDMETVGEASDGREAVELARKLIPDVVLMDISMPNLNGLTAAAQLKRIAPEIKILTLTRHNDSAYLSELIQAGVNGYVLKQSSAKELIRAIRTIAAGENFLDPAVTDKVFAAFTEGGKNTNLRGEKRTAKLTERESETLRHVALGYSNREIADKFGISVKTIEAHKANAMQKLDLKNRRDIINYAILQGWMQNQ